MSVTAASQHSEMSENSDVEDALIDVEDTTSSKSVEEEETSTGKPDDEAIDVAKNEEEVDPLPPEEHEMVKRSLYKHPLFPLLAYFSEKCEVATATCGTQVPKKEKMEKELKAFVDGMKGNWSSGDPVIDDLMIRALQVLRIHLGEMEKVNELCNNFCTRYISCLREKMHSSNLLKDAHFSDDGDSEDESCSIGSGGESSQDGVTQAPPKKIAKMALSSGSASSSTGMSASSQKEKDKESEKDRSTGSSSTSSRGVLPKQATELMRAWLFSHIVHPYPSEEEKKIIAEQTNLSLLQVNNWFINARRRILQPMLEQNSTQAKS